MAKYIEKEAAIAWFMPYVHEEKSIEADVVISDLKGMKAADVEPVRHGRWEEADWFEPDYHSFGTIRTPKAALRCSNCKNCFKKELLCKDNYCPNCGARMDEEEKE